MNVQLLDQTVVLSGLKLCRNTQGSLSLQREYSFEFATNGERRYRGKTLFVGRRQISMQLEAHSLPEP